MIQCCFIYDVTVLQNLITGIAKAYIEYTVHGMNGTKTLDENGSCVAYCGRELNIQESLF